MQRSTTIFFKLMTAGILCLMVTGSPAADQVRLKDGRLLGNVIAIARRQGTVVVYRTGRTRYFPTRQVAVISLKKVNWPRPVSRSRLRKLIEKRVKESIRKMEIAGGAGEPWSENIALEDVEPLPDSRRPLWMRSAVLPGWGQWHEGRQVRGAGYFLGSLALGFSYLNTSRRVSRSRASFRQSITLGLVGLNSTQTAIPGAIAMNIAGKRAARNVNEYTDRANFVALLLAGLYGWNLWDAGQGEVPPGKIDFGSRAIRVAIRFTGVSRARVASPTEPSLGLSLRVSF